MKEILLSLGGSIDFDEVLVKRTISLSGFSRSQTAFGYNASTGKMVFVNGNGGGSVTAIKYPTTATRMNLDGTAQTTVAMGGTSTWMYGGCQIGDDLYICDGNDGTYNSKFRKLGITSGASPVSLAAVPQPYRHSAALVAYSNNTKLLRAFGYNGSTSVPDCHSYDIASNVWTAVAPSPIALHGVSGVHYQGKIYFVGGWDGQSQKSYPYVSIYNTATNTWSKSTAEVNQKLFPTGQGKVTMAWVSSVLVGDTIWTFTRAGNTDFLPPEADKKSMVIVKYHIPSDSFTYAIVKATQRFTSANVYIASDNEVRMYGGTDIHSGQSGYDDAYPRLTDCLVLSTS